MPKKLIKQGDIDRLNGWKICKNPNCDKKNQHQSLDNFTLNKSSGIYFTNCKKCYTKQKMETYIPHPKIPVLEKDMLRNWKVCNNILCEQKGQKLSLRAFSFDKINNRYETHCRGCELKYDKELRNRNSEAYKRKRNAKLKLQRNNDAHFIEITRKRKQRYHQKYKNTPRYKINKRMGGQIWASLKEMKKHRSWESLVNYTKEDLIEHLESLFTEGMTWEIFTTGQIHIEHILPKELFEFKDEKDILFQYCWELKNLRPMWGSDNSSKLDSLSDGRRAYTLTSQEKLDYLRSVGYDI